MAWFAELAGKAENLLNNLDEQTGVALRKHNTLKSKRDKSDFAQSVSTEINFGVQRTRRPVHLNTKKQVPLTETKSFSPPRRSPTPAVRTQANPIKDIKTKTERNVGQVRKFLDRPKTILHNLNTSPKSLVSDVHGDGEFPDHSNLRQRRQRSLPRDLSKVNSDDILQLQDLEIENTMLKNELNVLYTEVQDLIVKLQATEEGKLVVSNKELNHTNNLLDESDIQSHKTYLDREMLSGQLEQLKEKVREIADLDHNFQDEKTKLISENNKLKDTNNELEEKIKDLTKKVDEFDTLYRKMESELRHSQTNIVDLQNTLAKSNGECKRLEEDWETYKVRVKNMLYAKDNEIKSLQDGANFSEDTKVLVNQLENLKEERDELSEAVTNVRNECTKMKDHIKQLEDRHNSAERVLAALRDALREERAALREERAARNKIEAQYYAVSKDFKHNQLESGQTIASLRTALRDKEMELNQITESSSMKTSDTSALNVADFEVSRDIESEKIQYLTETLVQRQGKLDRLMAENNVLRIQMDKLESKLKSEMQRSANDQSIVNVQSDHKTKYSTNSLMTSVSARVSGTVKRRLTLKLFVVIYMMADGGKS